MTELRHHNGKVTSDKKMIFISHQRNKGGKKDFSIHFYVIFETTSKFQLFFISLVFGKLGVDGVTGQQRESDVKYESDLMVILKGLRCRWRFWQPFLTEFPSNN